MATITAVDGESVCLILSNDDDDDDDKVG